MSNENNDDFLPDDDMMNLEPLDDASVPDDDPFAESSEPAAEELSSEEVSPEAEAFPAEGMEEAPMPAAEEAEEEPEEEKEIIYRPPHMDLYTVLLALALLFVTLAATLHFFECPASEYGKMPFKKGSPLVTAPANP